MGRLTDTLVRQAKPKPTQYEESDGLNGLVLVVYPSGKKSWAVRYRDARQLNKVGKPAQRKATLGPVDRMTLGQARKEARALMSRVDDGDYPAGKNEPSATGRDTVEDVAKRFFKEHRKRDGSPLRESSRDEIKRQFKAYITPAIGQRPIAEVTGDEVRKMVKERLDEGRGIMANRLHATLSSFFKWCCHKDQRILAANPYSGFDKPAGEVARERVLSNTELAALWHAAGATAQPFGPIIRLLILTGQRREEVTGMREVEIDTTRAEWTIPSERAKNGDRHVVHLSQPALDELAKVKRVGRKGLIFTTNGTAVYGGHGKAKAALDKALQFNEHWIIHDIRRTVATGMAALGVPVTVIESIENRRTGTRSGVAGIYNRHQYRDEMELALVAWGRFIIDIIAVDARRIAYDRMRARDRPPFNVAIHADNDAWSEYLAAMDQPAETEAAA